MVRSVVNVQADRDLISMEMRVTVRVARYLDHASAMSGSARWVRVHRQFRAGHLCPAVMTRRTQKHGRRRNTL